MGITSLPDDALTIEIAVAALIKRPWGAKIIVMGNFNADLEHPEEAERDEDIVENLAAAGLDDMLAYFLPQRRPWCQDSMVWIMFLLGSYVWSWTDNILGTDLRLFRNVSACYPRHNSYNYVILQCLHSDTLRGHTKYLGQRTRLPIQTLTTQTREDGLFADFRWPIPKPNLKEARKNAWILVDT